MTEGCAPVRLPFTTKPLRTELFSSWWLRVAAANFVSARELLCGFHSRHPDVPLPSSLDSCLDPVFLKAIAHFCRVPIAALQSLDLVQRLPHSQHALLLRFGSASPSCHRHCDLRVGYAFCPICIAEHPIVHVPWDWCLACLVCCSVHGTSLQLGCHSCGEPDPISFVVPPTHACWSCGADLTSGPRTLDGLRKTRVAVVERAYREALLGVAPDPTLLGQVSDRQFRCFVDDMLQLLTRDPRQQQILQSIWKQHHTLPPGSLLLATIAGLILNATPSSDPRLRSIRYRKSLKLWADLLPVLSQSDADAMEKSSRLWPVTLRRRYASALLHYKRKCWPFSPFRLSGSTGFKSNERFEFRQFNATRRLFSPYSGI
jgi:TniQ